MKIFACKDVVKHFLERDPRLRDNDYKLISNVWHYQAKHTLKIDLSGISAFKFLKMYSEGKFFSTESIRRTRQKIQEQYPELAGNKKIKQELEVDVRSQVRNERI